MVHAEGAVTRFRQTSSVIADKTRELFDLQEAAATAASVVGSFVNAVDAWKSGGPQLTLAGGSPGSPLSGSERPSA